jgi:RNA polymerase sigma factor (sigma-70 family)
MSSTPLLALIARCRVLCRPRTHGSDAELLTRFVQERDAAAFEELLERYAALVWGVCRRILPNEADCEDAFQAVFLALVRQAAWLDGRRPLGTWLHTVAVRVARKASAQTRRQGPPHTLPERTTSGDIADDVSSRELFRLVDEEIEHLPARLRMPILLCCLQGRTRDEAAAALGCSVSAVKSRLERGHHLLRRRLAQRGVQLPAAFLTLGLTSERIRAGLWAKTLLSVRYTPAPAVAALAEVALPGLMIGKGKLALVLLLLATSMGGVFGSVLISTSPSMPAAPPQAKAAEEPKKLEASQVRRDRHGDPLPEGAIARLGTVRWRHGYYLTGLAYSPDGKKIATVGGGRSLIVWDATSGKEIAQSPNVDYLKSVAFSSDGKLLATGGLHDFCRLWDVATAKEIRQIDGGKIAFLPDGNLVTMRRDTGTDSRLGWWDKIVRRLQRRIEYDGDSLAYSPNGKWIATSDTNGTIHLWDPATGEEQRQLRGHEKGVFHLAFSPNGSWLASSSEDETIRLWDTATGRQGRIFHEKRVNYSDSMPIAFSPDGRLLASGDRDGMICLRNMLDGAEKRRWQAGAREVRALAFSPDGKTLCSATARENMRFWDVATGRERHPSDEHRSVVLFVRFSSDGGSLVSLGYDGRLLWWDLAKRFPRRQVVRTTPGFIPLALSPDGETLSELHLDTEQLQLCDLRTGKCHPLGKKCAGSSLAITFSSDGRLFAYGGEDHAIHLVEVHEGKEIRSHKGSFQHAISLRFSPDGKTLAGDIGTQELRLWEVDSGKEVARFPCFNEPVQPRPLAFSPDGKVFAAGVGNEKGIEGYFVQLWDTASGKEWSRHTGHQEPVGAIAFSPDGKLVVSVPNYHGRKDNSVHVWEAATGRLIRRFEGHHSCVASVDFAPDGLSVASGSGDSTILLWDITGRRGDGRWHVKPLTPSQLEDCWIELANEDAVKAYDAVWALAAAPEQAVRFLGKHLPSVPQPEAKSLARLIVDLDSDEFRVREKATKDLSKLGDAAALAVRQALERKPTLEMRRRLQQLLDQSRNWVAERLREHRAIQALEHIGTRQAKEVLKNLAAGAPDSLRTEEAKTALQRMLNPTFGSPSGK